MSRALRAVGAFGVLILPFGGGCKKDEVVATRFNAEGESVEVRVTADTALGEPVSLELMSSTGTVVVGTASVDPGSGPVGTDHQVLVIVDDAYEAEVDQVSVTTDAGDRGTEVHDLVQDSADHGFWTRTLTSFGTEGEERVDTFTFDLFATETTDTDAGDGG